MSTDSAWSTEATRTVSITDYPNRESFAYRSCPHQADQVLKRTLNVKCVRRKFQTFLNRFLRCSWNKSRLASAARELSQDFLSWDTSFIVRRGASIFLFHGIGYLFLPVCLPRPARRKGGRERGKTKADNFPSEETGRGRLQTTTIFLTFSGHRS